MKNVLFSVAILLSGTAFAQPLANHLYFSGQLGFSSQSGSTSQGSITVEDPDVFSYSVVPSIGYTLTDNIMVGVQAVFSGSRTSEINGAGDEEEDRSSTTGAALFGRYYIPINERFLFYPELSIGYGKQSSETETAGVVTENPDNNIFRVGITPGLAYYPTTHWAIELSAGFIGYTSVNSTNEDPEPDIESSTSRFDFLVNALSVNVGVSYLLQL